MVRALIVGLALLLSGCVSAPEHDVYMPSEEWLFVCEALPKMGYTAVDCDLTPRPVVVITELVEDYAPEGWILYGMTYDGEPYIFVNSEQSPDGWMETIVHEATHYLLTQTYGMEGMSPDAVSNCESEWAAREVGSLYSGEPVDTGWVASYGCTGALD